MMHQRPIGHHMNRTSGPFFIIVLIVMLSFIHTILFSVSSVSAAQLGSRSLRIENPAAGVLTRHTFTFSYATNSTPVGSVVIEYCTSPLIEIACTAPAGLNASAATLAGQNGETGFSIVTAESGRLVLSRTASNPSVAPSTYVFDAVTNPTGAPDTFYARISTYQTMDGSGSLIDFGAVVSSTTQGVQISTEVPPILKFCVGIALADDCTTADESIVDLGDLGVGRASSGSSQMIAATNAEFGLAIAVYGTTLTSGNNVIPALSSPTVSAPGNAQFGINLRQNTNPTVGQEPLGAGISQPSTDYNQVNRYMFASGSVVATSPVATDSRKFTTSYVANISPGQAPGVYTATLTYICTATF